MIIALLITLAILAALFLGAFAISAAMLSSKISASERQNGTDDDET